MLASSSARVAGVFLADGMGYIVFIDNKADNLFPRCLSRSTQMRYDPLEHTTTEAADYRFYY